MARQKTANKKRHTESFYRDDEGRLCVGTDCIKIKLPDKSGEPIDIDLSECPDEVKKELGGAVTSGAPTAYDFRKSGKKAKK